MCGKSPWDLSSYRAKYLLKAPETPGPSTHQCCLHHSSHFLSRSTVFLFFLFERNRLRSFARTVSTRPWNLTEWKFVIYSSSRSPTKGETRHKSELNIFFQTVQFILHVNTEKSFVEESFSFHNFEKERKEGALFLSRGNSDPWNNESNRRAEKLGKVKVKEGKYSLV